MTAEASVIPDGAQIAFTVPGGHEQVIDWSDLLAILDSRVAAAEVASVAVGLVADTGSGQGDGVIDRQFNVYITVGTAGDAATLPAVFTLGQLVYVKNDAAVNSMDVFPAVGDDAGAGTDTAVAVAAGIGMLFMCTTENSVWTALLAT